MKKTKTFKYCEYCDKAWEDISPPTKEAYKRGLIKIDEAVMLLAKPKRKKGCSSSHSVYIGGIFCDKKCLLEYLKEKSK